MCVVDSWRVRRGEDRQVGERPEVDNSDGRSGGGVVCRAQVRLENVADIQEIP